MASTPKVAKAEKAVAGQAAIKRNRFVTLSGGTRTVNRELEAKARTLAGWKPYVTNLTAPADFKQLARLRQNTTDPGALLGTAKDLLEATAKFILEELELPVNDKMSFDELWHHARDRLGILPQQVASGVPGGACIKAILQSSWKIAEQVNLLRGLQGAGHGRTLPTGVTQEQALLVVREACSVAEFALGSLDRQIGRRESP